jgi:YesN/AraC family two-component response regulator
MRYCNLEKLKVLIVDDEYLIRNLLKLRINWQDYGMEVIGEATNTSEALDMVDEYMPDIIFSDICMPFMDGIEFSRIVLERFSNVKIVILTGHEEFEYARRSVKVGVFDFILKPINAQEIGNLLSEIKVKIEYEKLEKNELKKLKLIVKVTDINQEDRNENQIISQIKDYIRTNINRHDISLTSISKLFYISPGHLSRLFKQYSSDTFIEFVTKVRIEKVLNLLNETDLKVYEIAELVGIEPHYLSIIFKKTTGISINHFKKNNF